MGGLFAVCAGVVVVNEGTSNKAYKDSAGVWTICYGETKDVKPGDTKTDAECSAQLAKSLQEHAGALEGLPDKTPDVVLIGSVDMAYNIGVYAFRNSTVKKKLMQGDYAGASAAVLQWRYITRNGKKYDCSQLVNGQPNKVCYGLWKRRLVQSQAIGNKFKTPGEALAAFQKL